MHDFLVPLFLLVLLLTLTHCAGWKERQVVVDQIMGYNSSTMLQQALREQPPLRYYVRPHCDTYGCYRW